MVFFPQLLLQNAVQAASGRQVLHAPRLKFKLARLTLPLSVLPVKHKALIQLDLAALTASSHLAMLINNVLVKLPLFPTALTMELSQLVMQLHAVLAAESLLLPLQHAHQLLLVLLEFDLFSMTNDATLVYQTTESQMPQLAQMTN